jgi:hypothetical protein
MGGMEEEISVHIGYVHISIGVQWICEGRLVIEVFFFLSLDARGPWIKRDMGSKFQMHVIHPRGRS